MIKIIESEENKIIKYVNKLKNPKYIKSEKRFIIEGFHLLEMAKKEDIDFILTLEKIDDLDENITQYIVNEKIMKKLSVNKSFSKVIAVCKIKENSIVEGDLILFLDSLQDPGNIGTILRTALAFNIKTIISTSLSSFYNQKCIQASQGAIFSLNLIKGDVKMLFGLKEEFELIGTSLKKDTIDLRKFVWPKKAILIVGNEGNGVSKEVLDIVDKTIKIPISNIDSLNVGIATGILLYNYISTK